MDVIFSPWQHEKNAANSIIYDVTAKKNKYVFESVYMTIAAENNEETKGEWRQMSLLASRKKRKKSFASGSLNLLLVIR